MPKSKLTAFWWQEIQCNSSIMTGYCLVGNSCSVYTYIFIYNSFAPDFNTWSLLPLKIKKIHPRKALYDQLFFFSKILCELSYHCLVAIHSANCIFLTVVNLCWKFHAVNNLLRKNYFWNSSLCYYFWNRLTWWVFLNILVSFTVKDWEN